MEALSTHLILTSDPIGCIYEMCAIKIVPGEAKLLYLNGGISKTGFWIGLND